MNLIEKLFAFMEAREKKLNRIPTGMPSILDMHKPKIEIPNITKITIGTYVSPIIFKENKFITIKMDKLGDYKMKITRQQSKYRDSETTFEVEAVL